jgi:hypothetical protein
MLPLAMAAGASLLSGLFNKQKAARPVPFNTDYKPVDPQAEQRRAIQGNIDESDSIEQLLSRADRYTQGQANSLMEMAVPGYAKTAEKFMRLAGDNIDNRYSVPKEVSDNLTRIAAERGINTGVRGQAGDFSLLRDLGVNMLDYGDRQVNQAQSLLSTIAGLSPRVSPMSPLSFYVMPGQQTGVAQGNQQTQLGIDQIKHGVAQGGENAKTAASNWNTQNLWQSLSMAAVLAGAAGKG